MAKCAVCRKPLHEYHRIHFGWFCSNDCMCQWELVRLLWNAHARVGADQGPAQVTQSAVCDTEDRRG